MEYHLIAREVVFRGNKTMSQVIFVQYAEKSNFQPTGRESVPEGRNSKDKSVNLQPELENSVSKPPASRQRGSWRSELENSVSKLPANSQRGSWRLELENSVSKLPANRQRGSWRSELEISVSQRGAVGSSEGDGRVSSCLPAIKLTSSLSCSTTLILNGSWVIMGSKLEDCSLHLKSHRMGISKVYICMWWLADLLGNLRKH